MGRIVPLNLPLRRGEIILDAETLDQHLLSEGHGRTDAHADHVRHRPQEVGRSPTTDQHIAPKREFEDLLGRVAREAFAVDLPSLEK